MKLCDCGCGSPTPVAKRTSNRDGFKKGEPRRFAPGHHVPSGENHYAWKGGRSVGPAGHIYLSDNGTMVLEHRKIASDVLGKPLPPGVVVHHLNNNAGENANNNLVICENDAYHKRLHQRQTAYLACGNYTWRKCVHCKQYDSPEKLYRSPNGWQAYHRDCHKEYSRNRKAHKDMLEAIKEQKKCKP